MINEGYEIIESEVYATLSSGAKKGVALGRMNTQYGEMFVTWEYQISAQGETSFFWGHYFNDTDAARADYHRRLIPKYEHL